ncbi:uncharacterized protein LOC112089872 [Eutrema salsugineum]|uniref:uncharacterized protein LOC112089872 n=1 Tax=Eutrema salsugineum TaxID=72664 RepID=UPI000CED5648|nr:uncharacterized protein LOC112089872 [Eutrema salsugineum]
MQILRSVVAQCYRRGRSLGDRQSRNFSSSTCTNEWKRESPKAGDWLYGGFCVLLSCKFLQLGGMMLEMDVYEEIAAKEGKKVAFSTYLY